MCLNVAWTPSRLFRVRQLNSPNCTLCDTEADIAHLLINYPEYAAARNILRQRITDMGINDLSLPVLLGPTHLPQWKMTAALLQFIKNTGLLDNL